MRLLLALFALAIVVAGCGDDEGSAATSPSFEGIPWLLVSGIDAPGWEKVAPSANFEGGTVTGFNGCNQFTAPYTAHGDKLKIGLVASTMMACAPPGDAIEQAYNATLGKVRREVERGERPARAPLRGRERPADLPHRHGDRCVGRDVGPSR